MRPILTADEMRAADAWTIVHGVPGPTLMENAGLAVARAIESRFGKERRVAIVCGLGNNGGDGFVVARVLKSDWTRVYIIGDADSIKGDARHHFDRLRKERVRLQVSVIRTEADWAEKASELGRCSLMVDALLGSGSRGAPRDLAPLVIDSIRLERARGARVVSVDLPSGVPADGGVLDWRTVEADVTVTFAAKKPCLVFSPASELAGSVVVAQIGIPDEALQFADRGVRLYELEASDARAVFPPRATDSHKGDFGHVLVVAGSVGKSGAAVLATRGAFRTGAGLVTVASVTEVCRVVSTAQPEVMTESLGEGAECGDVARALARVLELAVGMDALVIGPGLGRSDKTQEFVLDVVARCGLPIVMDADGLYSLRAQALSRIAQRDQPTILTPHPGEMARLLGTDSAAVQKDRVNALRRAVAETRSTVVLKGRHTLIGNQRSEVWLNPTGSPSLATAGAGDVLAGAIGAILARGVAPDLAAAAGVFIHGLAGERTGKRRPWGVVAGDIADTLPKAIAGLRR
ncbi:MAG: NAD(P)H-hydrate dehydratase [Vicinamibacteria bacterium]|nr:NAD(P)H-hydrate dehydratase [Vicinamibacteria bacterium]